MGKILIYICAGKDIVLGLWGDGIKRVTDESEKYWE